MCFAPQADLAVGTIVAAIGVDALRHVRAPKQIVLASIPLLLGLHQLTETFVWWGLQGHVSHSVERAAIWTYLFFAFVALPTLLPIAVGLVERSMARRLLIAGLGAIAIAVAANLGVAMFREPIGAMIDGRHVAYHMDALGDGGRMTSVYVIATCGALLASSYRDLEILGALNLLAVPVLAWLTLSGLVSLWCFWAAIVSLVIALHLRRCDQRPWPTGRRPRFTRSDARITNQAR